MTTFWKILGGFLMLIGCLVAAGSGLCALVWLSVVFREAPSAGEGLGLMGMMLVYAGVPLAFGVALFVAGRALVRSTRGEVRGPPG